MNRDVLEKLEKYYNYYLSSIKEEFLLKRSVSPEETKIILSKMNEKDLLKYEDAMSESERLDAIEKMGRRRYKKLSILEKSIYSSTKEDILRLNKRLQSGESLLDIICSSSYGIEQKTLKLSNKKKR